MPAYDNRWPPTPGMKRAVAQMEKSMTRKLADVKITVELLKKHSACSSQVNLFEKTFPDGVFVSEAGCVKYASLFNWGWAAAYLLDETANDAYYSAIKAASDAYYSAIKAPRDAYYSAIKRPRDAYCSAIKTASDAYSSAIKRPRDAYCSAIKTASDAYYSAKATAFARAYLSQTK